MITERINNQMDKLTGTVLTVISGPTRRVEKTTVTQKTWLDGTFTGETEKSWETIWWEVETLVDEEFRGQLEKTFKITEEDQAARIVPGYTYNF
jgi:hypothetical protein